MYDRSLYAHTGHNGGNAVSECEAPTRQRDLGSGPQIGNPGVSTHEDVP